MPENSKNSNSLTQPSAEAVEKTSSRLSGVIFLIICATLIFAVIAFGAVDYWALGVLSILSGLIAVLWLTDTWLNKEFHFSSNSLQIPLLGLVFIGLVQLLPLRSPGISSDLLTLPAVASLSIAPYATRLAIVQLIVYFIFFAGSFTFVNNHGRVQKIITFIIIFSSLMAFYGILQHLANMEAIYGLRLPNQAVPFASFINGHHFAAFMEMTLGLTLALVFGKATKDNKRIFLIIAVVVMGMAIVFTSSRGGLLSLLGVIGFIVTANVLRKPTNEANSPVENTKNYRRGFAYIGGGLVLILIFFGVVLLLGGDESLLRGTGLANPEDASNGRWHFWQIAWRIFLDYPILGAGLDAFAFAFTQYDTWNGMFRVEQAHNDYLQILADAGILGFACITVFIYLLFKQGVRTVGESSNAFRRNTAIGALAGCCGILIHSLFDFPLRTPSNAFFFLTLTVLATAAINPPKPARKRRRQ